jgi:anti-anti-sigma regulatory factor
VIVSVSRDFERGCTVVSLDGELTLSAMTGVRSMILKCLADCPVAVIVDLAGVHRCNDVALSIFATAQRHARHEPKVDLLICAPRQGTARALARSFRHLPVYPTREDALIAATATPAAEHWNHAHLLPVATAPAQARALVSDACLDWDLPSLLYPARWVISELTLNAVEHAKTEIDVTATRRGRFLHLGVRDLSLTLPRPAKASPFDPAVPMEERGQGLRIVSRFASHWGCTLTPDGKNVWAILTTGSLIVARGRNP